VSGKKRILELRRIQPKEALEALEEAERGGEPPIREQLIRLSEMYAETRDELIGLLKSRVGIGNMVKEQMLFWSEQQQGIMNAIKMLYKPRIPWNLILLTVFAVSVIFAVGSNPELVRQLNIFLSNPANQAFVVVFMIIAALTAYFIFRRRGRG
jgi:hypothetical protein